MTINISYSLTKVTILFFILIGVNLLFAGTTGKLKGHIYDKQTGEVLIGVNVWLMEYPWVQLPMQKVSI